MTDTACQLASRVPTEPATELPTELDHCDCIWALSEQEIDRQLAEAGADLSRLVQRVEEIAATAICQSTGAKGAKRRARTARASAADWSPESGTWDELAPREQKTSARSEWLIPDVEIFEIAGAIKWFDVSKGYGF